MTTALRGVGVLVTRPEQQAAPLCRLLQANGAATFRLSAVDIEANGSPTEWSTLSGRIEQYDLIIFTSANAVRFGVVLLAGPRVPSIAAIGPATARALADAGRPATVTSNAGFDSEALLAHPRLEHPAGRRVLIVKGSGGREYLREELGRRGALVTAIDVYRRRCPTPGTAALAALESACTAGSIHVITATSLEIVGNLIALATPELRTCFEHVHWLVPGGRVAAGARAQGITAPLLQAASAEDHDLLAALLRWRSSESAA